jgi:hypothetical protein
LRRCLSLAACLVISAILAIPLLVGFGNAGESSRATYDRIKMGMTRPEAEAIQGNWPQRWVRSHRVSVTVAREAHDGAMIEVDFDSNGRVTGKAFSEGDQSLAARMKRFVERLRLH